MSILATDTNPKSGNSSAIVTAMPLRWGPVATLAWTSGAGAVYVLTQLIGLFIFMVWWEYASPGVPFKLADLGTSGPLLAITIAVSTPAVLGVVMLAAHLSRVGIREYLGLYWPSLRELGLGLLVIGVLVPLTDLATWASGADPIPEFMTATYATAKAMGMVPLLVIAFVVLAPIGEEIVFRGFLYRGLATRLGPLAAIAITATIFGGLHVQYGIFLQLQILLIGLAFGWLRWRSGSTLLPAILHTLMNGVAVAQVMRVQGV